MNTHDPHPDRGPSTPPTPMPGPGETPSPVRDLPPVQPTDPVFPPPHDPGVDAAPAGGAAPT